MVNGRHLELNKCFSEYRFLCISKFIRPLNILKILLHYFHCTVYIHCQREYKAMSTIKHSSKSLLRIPVSYRIDNTNVICARTDCVIGHNSTVSHYYTLLRNRRD